MRGVVLALAAIAGLAACANHSSISPPAPAPGALLWNGSHVEPSDVQIEMERSECFGECPSYVVKLSGNGSIVWNGRKYVSALDERLSSVPMQDVQFLLDRFAELKFFELEPEYKISWSDLPTDTFRLRVGSRTRSVSNYAWQDRVDMLGREFPDWRIQMELKALADAIDSVLELERWEDRGTPDMPRADPRVSEPFGLKTGELANVEIEFRSLGDEVKSPEYTILVHGDGRVEWTGTAYVREAGRHEARISVEDVRRILGRFERAEFTTLSNVEFPGQKTCWPSVLTLRLPGLEKSVDFESLYSAPHAVWLASEAHDRAQVLYSLYQSVEVATRADRWRGGWYETHPEDVMKDH